MQAAQEGGANADLYANAGTAALQAERLGPAVLAFRRALALDPDHTTSQRNLAHARTLLPAWVPKVGSDSVFDTFFFWHRSLSTFERSAAAAVCFLLAALAIANYALRLEDDLWMPFDTASTRWLGFGDSYSGIKTWTFSPTFDIVTYCPWSSRFIV